MHDSYHIHYRNINELEGTSGDGVYEVIGEQKPTYEVKELPHSDDGEGFNLNECAAYMSVSTPHGRSRN